MPATLQLPSSKGEQEALAELGPFGEVRIVKQRGKLRFIRKVESMSIMEGSEKMGLSA